MDKSKLTGKDFEFLLTPSNIEVSNEDFDSIMTPDSMEWIKVSKNNWQYYQVGEDEFSYSFEPPGIQMCFNNEISYAKAKQVADEVAKKLGDYIGTEVIVNFIPTDRIIKF